VYVDVTLRPGMLEADPCADPEFRQGALCLRRRLPNGDLLVLRDIVADPGGMKTIEVVLVHPDRSGIGAEAGNWTIATLPNGTPVNQGELPKPRVTHVRIPCTRSTNWPSSCSPWMRGSGSAFERTADPRSLGCLGFREARRATQKPGMGPSPETSPMGHQDAPPSKV